jgi:hypothetical protein
MKRGSTLVIGGWIILAVAGMLRAQTTQPSPAREETPWQKTVHQFSDALGKGDKAVLQSLLGDKPVMHVFNATGNAGLDDLLALGKSAEQTIGYHAYQGAPQSMAADMAGDFKDNEKGIPDEVRRRMMPQEAGAKAKASATAVQWFEVNFDIKNSEWNTIPVGVVELWVNSSGTRSLAFVLVRGQQETDGSFRIVAVAWGNPLEKK